MLNPALEVDAAVEAVSKYVNLNTYIKEYLSMDKVLSIVWIIVSILFILLLRKIITKVLLKITNKVFNEDESERYKLDYSRMKTLKSVINSVIIYGIYFIAYIMIFEQLGIKIAPLLAAAGVGGLAIGFGAQSLVKDIITGFFILFENQFTVGDYITIDDKSGIVEELALRITKIRDFNGELHIIPNGSINRVTNKCRGSMRALVKIGISYEENIDNAIDILNDECIDIAKHIPDIIEGPKVLGVSDLGESDVIITTVAQCKPMEQWKIERLMRKRFKEAFDRNNIEIPYPKSVVYKGE